MTGSPEDDDTAGAVSEAVTRLFLDKFGKGPLHVETFVTGDVYLTLMRDVFSPAERAMIADGRHENVLTTRMLWQKATDSMFKEAIGAVTGRRVLAVISGFEIDRDMASEVFVMEPR